MKNTSNFEHQPGLSSSDPRSKDTSLPGREEEVIVNEQEQSRIVNTDDAKEEDEGDRSFKEGLQNNSDTDTNPQK